MAHMLMGVRALETLGLKADLYCYVLILWSVW